MKLRCACKQDVREADVSCLYALQWWQPLVTFFYTLQSKEANTYSVCWHLDIKRKEKWIWWSPVIDMWKCRNVEQIFITLNSLEKKIDALWIQMISLLSVRWKIYFCANKWKKNYIYFPLDRPGTWSECHVVNNTYFVYLCLRGIYYTGFKFL